jgi:glycosyltransferase involved in cell wall biosynthesis
MLGRLSLPFQLIVASVEQGGVEAARNLGVARASGRVCLFLDDDIVTDEHLVSAHLDVQRREGTVVTIGRLAKLLRPRARRWARYGALERREHYEQLAAGRPPNFLDCYGGNLCIPRELYLEVGGFATDIHVDGIRFGFRYNDIELGFRLQNHGARFIYVDEAFAVEDDRETLRDYVNDAEKRGASGLALYERHPELLPHLALGRWSELDGKWGALRSGLFALRAPPLLVGSIGSLVPTREWARSWYRLFFNYCYWRGVSRGLRRSSDRDHVLRILKAGGQVSPGGDIDQNTEDAVQIRQSQPQQKPPPTPTL